jgi:acetyltransferase
MTISSRNLQLDDGTPYQVCSCTEPRLQISREAWKRAMRESFERLSAKSRWQRFANGQAELSEAQLDYLTDVDDRNRVACCAVLLEHEPLCGIGIARYVRLADRPQRAEFAVTVIDPFQGQGVGSALLELLVETAAANGIETLYGNVLSSNTGMLRLCQRIGATLHPLPDFIEVELATGSTAR